MTVEIGILIGVFGFLFTAATFFINRQSAAKSEGSTLAELKKDIEYISKQVNSLCEAVDKFNKKYDDRFEHIQERIDRVDAKHSESIKRVHDRLDEHINNSAIHAQ